MMGELFLARLGVKKEHSLSYVTDEQQRLAKKKPPKSVHYFVRGALERLVGIYAEQPLFICCFVFC